MIKINNLKEKMRNSKKRGFTLIELVVVMVVIGILVLLAVPQFGGQIKEAEIAQIQNDIIVSEAKVKEWLILDDSRTDGWLFNLYFEDNELYNKKGELVTGIGGLEDITDSITNEINTQLDGGFYAESDGAVYYYSLLK